MLNTKDKTTKKVKLLNKVQCPHCWHEFAPEKILWVSASDNLLGDPVQGENELLRFLPSRFNKSGLAIDPDGNVCQHLACPNCHLIVARDLLTVKPSFISIVGTAGSGKSYLIASMVRQLRKSLPKLFSVTFADADTVSNITLHEYEELLFANPEDDKLVALQKTETQGINLYNQALISGQTVNFPRPFLFTLHRMENHYTAQNQSGFALVFYDNAGESFQPGADIHNSPVTRHVAFSESILFVFDPTKDSSLRKLIKSDDPQVTKSMDVSRQEVMINEIALRIRRLKNLAPGERHNKPLLVLISKADTWLDLVPGIDLKNPYRKDTESGHYLLDIDLIENISNSMRNFLNTHCPEFVGAVEGAWKDISFFPISSTGCSPVEDPESGLLGIKPRDISPVWAEVPILYFMAKWKDNIIPVMGKINKP